jgi:hypothetical protein
MRGEANKNKTRYEYSRNKGELSEDDFEDKMERNESDIKRVQKLINKFVTPSLFVKLKRRDVKVFMNIVDRVIDEHENYEVPEGEKPFLSDESYEVCKNVLIRLQDGYARSTSQDKK